MHRFDRPRQEYVQMGCLPLSLACSSAAVACSGSPVRLTVAAPEATPMLTQKPVAHSDRAPCRHRAKKITGRSLMLRCRPWTPVRTSGARRASKWATIPYQSAVKLLSTRLIDTVIST